MTTRDSVLEALRAAGAEGVSGESLARELGLSRAAIAKHVAALRQAGYRIDAAAGTGYRLTAVPDAPLPAEVRRLLVSTRWVSLHGGGETGSTMDDARSLAQAGAEDGTVVLARRQRTGRGRFGRTWDSPPGGVYFSAVLRPASSPAEITGLAPAVALGVSRGLERLGVLTGLKWPNDVLLGGRKLAGVLLEMAAEADLVTWVVAGVGINVRRRAAGTAGAAFIDEVAEGATTAEVAAAALDGIAQTLDAFGAGGFPAVRDEYLMRLETLGEHVRVSDAFGRRLAEGIASDVDERGMLEVLRADGAIVTVSSGEVTLRG